MAEMTMKNYIFRKGAAKKIPVSGTFELTPRCNLNCKMCYIHLADSELNHFGQELTASQWISLGEQAVRQGMVYLLLTGGEPLLCKDFCEIYTALAKMGLMITVNTNGTLISEKVVECFQKYQPEKVNITLYGMSDSTYAHLCGVPGGFRNAVRGIKRLKQAGIRVNLNTTFTKLNIADMEDLVSFAKEEQLPIRMSSFIFPQIRNLHETELINLSPEETGVAAAHFDELTLESSQIEKRKAFIQECITNTAPVSAAEESRMSSCMAGRGAFWISWDGKMYPCGMLPDFCQDVRNTTISEAWTATILEVQKIRLPRECTDCNYQHICPNCAAVSQSVNRKTDLVPSDMCLRTRAYVDAFLRIHTKDAGNPIEKS